MKTISLVVPVFYEEDCILQFIKEVKEAFAKLNHQYKYEFVFIDDGSRDKTTELIKGEAAKDPQIKLIEFSYNHGKQWAVTAGIKYATGDYMIYMDPDLQDPPEEIHRFIEEIEKGFDLVFGIRKEKKDNVVNVLFSKIFWWVLEKFTGLKLPKGIAVMRIFNRKFADKFLTYPEQNRFIEGIFMHVGLKQTTIEIQQRDRFAGVSKFNFRRKMKLAFDAIFDFSELPLKMAVKFGFYLMFLSILALLTIVVLRLFFIKFQIGWPSIIITIIGATGILLYFIGVLAIYIGRIYKEVKARPLFSIKELTNINE
ncbi:MAG: glycosyltransferase family 2 protein [Bacteroidota bacterium]|nr:glycosyltransferase family 2 protein [Bacteroidota bacterium]